jgi:hypothetical protein
MDACRAVPYQRLSLRFCLSAGIPHHTSICTHCVNGGWRSLRWDSKVWIRVIALQSADPSSRQRGRPTETRPQFPGSNVPTGSNIWSQVPEWARHQDILTDWLTDWLTDRPTVSGKVTSNSTWNMYTCTRSGFCSSRIPLDSIYSQDSGTVFALLILCAFCVAHNSQQTTKANASLH